MKTRTYLYLLLIVLMACKKEPKIYANKLEKSLELSGKNRTELEKVLAHYSKNTEDSLKYKAALFLIENMEGHHYRLIKSRNEWDHILELSDSLIINDDENHERILDSSFQKLAIKYSFKKDIEEIRAKNMTGNIEAAFKVWPKPWNAYLDFNGFCNYILPYRQKDEPLELSLREKQYQENIEKINDITSIDSMIQLAKEVSSFPDDFKYKRLIPFDQSISDIKKGRMTDCVDISIYSAFKGRTIGIPMAIDFAIWPNFRSSHYWNSIVFDKDSTLYADKDFFWGEPGSYRLRRKVAKIYRLMYASQEPFDSVLKDNKTWTFLDNPNILDVTSQYIKTTNIIMKLRTVEEETFSTAYLCVFNDRKWRPVAKSSINQEAEVQFNGVGRENIYIIFYLDKNKRIPASEAFSVNKEGNIFTYKANVKKIRDVSLDRKSQLTYRVKNFGANLSGGLFQLSNTPNFETTENVYAVPDNDTVLLPRIIDVKLKKTYRYARYRSVSNGSAEIAEMKWFSGKDTISGTIIGTSENTEQKEDIENVFDDDDLSYFLPKKIEGSYTWVGLDFGEEKKVSKLKFSPRSDLNYVKPRDTYELFYWTNQWVSLGKKKAKAYFVSFEDVPENALLWLRNLNEGIEEDLFIYKDDKQHFWYSSEY